MLSNESKISKLTTHLNKLRRIEKTSSNKLVFFYRKEFLKICRFKKTFTFFYNSTTIN